MVLRARGRIDHGISLCILQCVDCGVLHEHGTVLFSLSLTFPNDIQRNEFHCQEQRWSKCARDGTEAETIAGYRGQIS